MALNCLEIVLSSRGDDGPGGPTRDSIPDRPDRVHLSILGFPFRPSGSGFNSCYMTGGVHLKL